MRDSILPVPTPRHTPGKARPVWPRGREFPEAVLPGGRGAGQIEITTRARTYGVAVKATFFAGKSIEYVSEWLD